ncbi:MAG TPA: hypothetical protein VKB52_00980 [Rhodanobacteraceae bacterium]|nr:hypothetical protein [Rhodanobacteraceae bacterium]
MKTAAKLLAALMVASLPSLASAACKCQCVNGQIEAVCRSTTDLPPVCAPRTCSAKQEPGSVIADKGLASGKTSPVATPRCRETLVPNPATGAYIIKQVCQ